MNTASYIVIRRSLGEWGYYNSVHQVLNCKLKHWVTVERWSPFLLICPLQRRGRHPAHRGRAAQPGPGLLHEGSLQPGHDLPHRGGCVLRTYALACRLRPFLHLIKAHEGSFWAWFASQIEGLSNDIAQRLATRWASARDSSLPGLIPGTLWPGLPRRTLRTGNSISCALTPHMVSLCFTRTPGTPEVVSWLRVLQSPHLRPTS